MLDLKLELGSCKTIAGALCHYSVILGYSHAWFSLRMFSLFLI